VPFSHDDGRSAALELIAAAQPPTAIVCGNDVVAMGVLSAARSAGLRVPGDLTVIGFDDIRMAAWPLINLTTVHCDLELMAGEAVGLLMQQLEGSSAEPVVKRIPVALRLRGTHGPPMSAPAAEERSTGV
jgi:LacI family transcriptional regulator